MKQTPASESVEIPHARDSERGEHGTLRTSLFSLLVVPDALSDIAGSVQATGVSQPGQQAERGDDRLPPPGMYDYLVPRFERWQRREILKFIPPELENRLARIELEYAMPGAARSIPLPKAKRLIGGTSSTEPVTYRLQC